MSTVSLRWFPASLCCFLYPRETDRNFGAQVLPAPRSHMPFLLIRVVLATEPPAQRRAILLSHSFRTSLLVIISPITVAPRALPSTRAIPRHFLPGHVEPFAAAFVFATLFFVLASAIDGMHFSLIIMFRRCFLFTLVQSPQYRANGNT